MRYSRAAVALLLIPLVATLPPAGVAQPLVPQDDDGRGEDAPDTFDEAWRLKRKAGSVEGELVAGGQQHDVRTIGDYEDWYQVRVNKGHKITVFLENTSPETGVEWLTGPTHGNIRVHVVTPEDKIARVVLQNLEEAFYASDGGMWRFRVYTWDTGAEYRFDYRITEPDPGKITGAFSDVGYVVLGFDAEPGAGLTGRVWQDGGLTASGPTIVYQTNFREDGTRLGAKILKTGPINSGFHVQVLGQSESEVVRPSTDCPCLQAPIDPAGLTGRFYLSSVISADWTYVSYELTPTGDVTFLGATTGPRDQLTVLGYDDFGGDLAVEAGGAVDIAANVGAEIVTNKFLLGTYTCEGVVKNCRVIAPDGSQVGNVGLFMASPLAGSWGFFRDRLVAPARGEAVLVLAADVDLPSGDEQGGKPPKTSSGTVEDD